MNTTEALAVTRLRQWAASRDLLLRGRGHSISRSGWVERRVRTFDAHHVRVIDFEAAFSTLPEAAQQMLLLIYRDNMRKHEAASVLGVHVRTVFLHLPKALAALADALDRRHLL